MAIGVGSRVGTPSTTRAGQHDPTGDEGSRGTGRRGGRRTGRWALAASLGALALAGVSGCSTEPFTAAAAQNTYDPALRAVADATASATKLTWTEGKAASTGATSDGCTWWSQTLTSTTDLADPAQWNTVIDATRSALEQHGFGEAAAAEIPGGFTGVEASDERGAKLTITAKGSTTLRISVPVSDAC